MKIHPLKSEQTMHPFWERYYKRISRRRKRILNIIKGHCEFYCNDKCFAYPNRLSGGGGCVCTEEYCIKIKTQWKDLWWAYKIGLKENMEVELNG